MKSLFLMPALAIGSFFVGGLAQAKINVYCAVYKDGVKSPVAEFEVPLVEEERKAVWVGEDESVDCSITRKQKNASIQCSFQDRDGVVASTSNEFLLMEHFDLTLVSRLSNSGEFYRLRCASNI